MIHYPRAGTEHGPRQELVCSCGFPAWERCTGEEPGQRLPGEADKPGPVWAFVFSVVACAGLVAFALGAHWVGLV